MGYPPGVHDVSRGVFVYRASVRSAAEQADKQDDCSMKDEITAR
jgi:hypothetical protein